VFEPADGFSKAVGAAVEFGFQQEGADGGPAAVEASAEVQGLFVAAARIVEGPGLALAHPSGVAQLLADAAVEVGGQEPVALLLGLGGIHQGAVEPEGEFPRVGLAERDAGRGERLRDGPVRRLPADLGQEVPRQEEAGRCRPVGLQEKRRPPVAAQGGVQGVLDPEGVEAGARRDDGCVVADRPPEGRVQPSAGAPAA